MLKAWENNFNVNRDLSQPNDWMMGEPLFYNPLIQTRTLVFVVLLNWFEGLGEDFSNQYYISDIY